MLKFEKNTRKKEKEIKNNRFDLHNDKTRAWWPKVRNFLMNIIIIFFLKKCIYAAPKAEPRNLIGSKTVRIFIV